MKKVKIDKDSKIFEKSRYLYKIEEHDYPSGHRIELWRKNPLGYYNFICFLQLNNETCFKKAIIEDQKKIDSTKLNKRNIKEESDD